MVPGWFRAFRLVLVSNDKTAHRASPTASEDSGMVPRWFRVFRLQLASTDETTHRVSPTTSYGFGMVPRWFRALREAGEGWLELERLGNMHTDFLPKLIPSLIRLGSNLVKKYEIHGGWALRKLASGWAGWACACVCVAPWRIGGPSKTARLGGGGG